MNIYNKFINRLGETNLNTFGSLMTIVEYNNANNIIIEFENGYKVKSSYDDFKKGLVKDPLNKNIHGIACIGIGKYRSEENRKDSRIYQTWKGMLQRCYSDNHHKKRQTYINCTVCEEWHNFQNFAKWFEENYYEIDGFKMQLDKDILIKGNKIYSPETCVFVPIFINLLFIKNNINRGKYPIGVYYSKKRKKFISSCKYNSKIIHLGQYNTAKEAFQAYKNFKENYIKEIAEKYKDKIPEKLYLAMYNYEVEITD